MIIEMENNVTDRFSQIAEDIKNFLKDDLNKVNTIIAEKMENKISLIPQIARHIVSSGGKRIRPLLTLLSAKMVNYHGNKDILLAACVEFIHTATILHDDVVDESDSRRGLLTSNSIWGNKASVLVGDFLFTKSFELMVQAESLSILEVLSKTSSIIAQGEVMQLSNINNIDLSFTEYYEIIFSKTASLFSAAIVVGAMLEKTDKSTIENLEKFGVSLGIVFQIMDDIIDYSGNKIKTGKDIGVDFKEGKITLPIILTLQECNNEEKKFLIKTLVDMDQQEGDFATVLNYIEKYNVVNKAINIADNYIQEGLIALQDININNEYKQLFIDLLSSSSNRSF